MAKRVVLIDDLDGSDGSETLRYGLDGKEYEIDLSEKNAVKLRSTLQTYIERSIQVEHQPVVPARSARRRSATGGTRDDIPQVRAWAQARGLEVNPRGRIKKEILDEYDAEHSGFRTSVAPAREDMPRASEAVTPVTAGREAVIPFREAGDAGT